MCEGYSIGFFINVITNIAFLIYLFNIPYINRIRKDQSKPINHDHLVQVSTYFKNMVKDKTLRQQPTCLKFSKFFKKSTRFQLFTTPAKNN